MWLTYLRTLDSTPSSSLVPSTPFLLQSDPMGPEIALVAIQLMEALSVLRIAVSTPAASPTTVSHQSSRDSNECSSHGLWKTPYSELPFPFSLHLGQAAHLPRELLLVLSVLHRMYKASVMSREDPFSHCRKERSFPALRTLMHPLNHQSLSLWPTQYQVQSRSYPSNCERHPVARSSEQRSWSIGRRCHCED